VIRVGGVTNHYVTFIACCSSRELRNPPTRVLRFDVI
jgi:hypothetical protein